RQCVLLLQETADIGTSSFRITAAPDKSFKKGRVDIDAQGSTLTLSGLKSGKTYYVKARPYIEGYDPGKGKNVRYYGAGSKTVTIKCK
ncbi:MAG: hypothetical protein IJ723_05795, partial [Ruminococcus sp.]|nr:hypothetical protein [Ruminococcus sp.]